MRSSAKRLDLTAVALAVATLVYPLAVVVAVHTIGPMPIVFVLIGLLVVRGIVPTAQKIPKALTVSFLAVAAAELVVASRDAELAARLYPVFMNATMLIAFTASLAKPPTMIERFARLMEPDLDVHGIRYTRSVTWIWVGFFFVNGSVALWTVLNGSWLVWSIYNGGVAYVLAGSLFAGEFLVRKRVRARAEKESRAI